MSSDSARPALSIDHLAANCRIWLIRFFAVAMIAASILKAVSVQRESAMPPSERAWVLATTLPELACGSWLLMFAASTEAVLVSILVAFAFSTIDAYKAYVLTSDSCGCFGDFQLHPITVMGSTLGLGATITLAAYLSRPTLRFQAVDHFIRDPRNLTWLVITLASVAGAATAGLYLSFLSPAHVRISTDYLKNVPPDEHIDVTLVARNLTNKEMRIIG